MSDSIYALAIPKWGIEMENGTVTEWHSELGASVTKGDDLVDLESDKIINTLEATATGVLRRKFADEGDQLVVGELIGIIADADASDEAIDAFVTEFKAGQGEPVESSPAEVAPVAAAPAAAESPVQAPTEAGGKVRVSPPVRRKAEQLGVDISTVTGSGPGGRITSDDIDRAASGGAAPAASEASLKSEAGAYTSKKLSATQQTMGRRLVESKQSVPHFYLSTDIVLDRLLAKRKELNENGNQKVSVNDMIVWCVARALKTVPSINAQLVGDEIREFTHADVAVAVATERGLFTPVVQSAENKTVQEVASAIAELVDKAKNNNLQRDDIGGGSFTVSNLGMYGVTRFDAIINPPQVAILAIGQAKKTVVVTESNETSVAMVLSVNLSCDHRVVDGALGGTFLAALKSEIESID